MSNVREAMVRIRQEEEEDDEEMAEHREGAVSGGGNSNDDAANMRMRKVSSALEAVVTDQGIVGNQRADYER